MPRCGQLLGLSLLSPIRCCACNNDIEEATDDAIEADSAMGNVRVMRNRIRNCFDGCSSQPNLGGPTYYIRNVMYNVLYSPFKFHNGTVGDVAFHNTVVKSGDGWGCYAGETWSRAFLRNNLFIGGTGGGTYGGYGNGTGRVLDLGDADATCSFDYDGLGSIDTGKFEGNIGSTRFSSLATLQANTSEVHAVAVDMNIFASAPAFPSNPYPAKPVVDLQLAAGSAAVDKGMVLAGINDGFSGAAPDFGAYEIGVAPRSTAHAREAQVALALRAPVAHRELAALWSLMAASLVPWARAAAWATCRALATPRPT
jgi:hypothetical protein